MVITKELIEEWRKERDNGMVSAVGEYTPPEFWAALDEIERLTAEIARLTEERDAFRASSEIRGANGEAMRALLAAEHERWMAALRLQHDYRGACPDDSQPTERDPNCPACRALIDFGAEHLS